MLADVDRMVSLIEQLVLRSFPALRNIRFSASIIDSPDSIAEVVFSLREKSAKVWVDRKDLRQMSEDAFTGCLAHELCHIEADLRRGAWGAWIYDPLYWRVPWLLAWEERRVDRAAIRKGYGRQLLALQQYHDSRYEPYAAADGLTMAEIEQEVAAFEHAPHRT